MLNHASSGRFEEQPGARLQHRRADRALGHDVDGEPAVDSGAFGQKQPLCEREHLHGQADVDRELQHEALPVLPHVRGRAQLAEHRLDARVGVLVSADHDGERSGLHLGDAARYRRVQQGGPLCADALGKLAARAWTDRAHVNPDLVGGEAGEDAVGPRCHGLEHLVVGHGREDDLGGLGDLPRRVAPLQAVLDEPAPRARGFAPRRRRGSPRRAIGLPCCRPCFPGRRSRSSSSLSVLVAIQALPSMVATSSSLSSRCAAVMIGSTWSGRRKPTMAPSTAGLRSVQATATAPAVVP